MLSCNSSKYLVSIDSVQFHFHFCFLLLVFKSLGSTGPSEFGSLGVSWRTKGSEDDKPPPATSGPAPSALEGPEYMPMAWDPLKGTESTILAAILSRRTS